MTRFLLVSCSLGALATAAGAQVPKPAEDQTSGIQDIIVTAQRRAESVQSVPIAIAVVTADIAQKTGIRTMDDINLTTPSINFTRSINASQVVLRGVGSTSSTAGDEPSVATYVDGVYMPAMQGGVFALNNIERIEVLNGPQGTLFGRNAAGGVVQIVTRDPKMTPELRANIGYGNYKTFDGGVYATGPITKGLAADLAVAYHKQADGYGTNIKTGNDINKREELSLRSKWLFELTPDTKVTVAGDYNKVISSQGIARRALPGAVLLDGVTSYPGGFQDTNENLDPVARDRQWGLSGHINHDFGSVQLVSITAYRDVLSRAVHDQDGTPAPIVNLNITIFSKTFSQELQLLSAPNSPIKWILGGFYYHQEAGYDPLGVVGSGLGAAVFSNTFSRMRTRSLAGFGQVTVPVFDGTNVTAGLRFTSDNRLLHDARAVNALSTTTFPNRDKTYNKMTWRFAVDQKITSGVMAYASYNRGFKSGLYNTTRPQDAPVNPETIDAFEIGLKSDLFDRRVRLNLAAFHTNYKNIQLPLIVLGATQLINAAEGRINGVELSTQLVPVSGLTLGANVSIIDGKYKEFPRAPFSYPKPAICNASGNPPGQSTAGARTGGNLICPGDAAGHKLNRVPPWTASLSAAYDVPLAGGNLDLSATYYYNNGFFWEPDNRVKQEPYQLLNSQVRWAAPGDRWAVRLWGKNLLNEKYYSNVSQGSNGDQGGVAEPRTYGLAFEVKL